jgi:hypothetical protein
VKELRKEGREWTSERKRAQGARVKESGQKVMSEGNRAGSPRVTEKEST